VTATAPPPAPTMATGLALAEDGTVRGAGNGASVRPPAVRSAPLTISRVLAVGVAAALAVDAYVHATSSGFYDPTHGGLITEGNLFRAEAVVSGASALLLVFRTSRSTFTAALLVAASALAAVVLYRYVDVGAIGPIPNLYEPTWRAPGKLPSAYAEGVAVVLGAAGIALARARRHRA